MHNEVMLIHLPLSVFRQNRYFVSTQIIVLAYLQSDYQLWFANIYHSQRHMFPSWHIIPSHFAPPTMMSVIRTKQQPSARTKALTFLVSALTSCVYVMRSTTLNPRMVLLWCAFSVTHAICYVCLIYVCSVVRIMSIFLTWNTYSSRTTSQLCFPSPDVPSVFSMVSRTIETWIVGCFSVLAQWESHWMHSNCESPSESSGNCLHTNIWLIGNADTTHRNVLGCDNIHFVFSPLIQMCMNSVQSSDIVRI